MVSIIIPVYNAEKTVRDTLDSVLMQTFTDYEVIMTDDCSTDCSYEILCEYAEMDTRFRVIKNEKNSGTSFSRNEAVKHANGEYVAFLDADDLWLPDKLQKQLVTVKSHQDALIWYTGSGFISADGKRKASILHVPERVDWKELLKQNNISCSSVVLRRETALDYPFPSDIRCHEDYAVWLSILSEGGYAYGLDEPLLTYRLGVGKSANKIRAALMNWRTYDAVGLGFFAKVRYMASYSFRSIAKYAKILLSGNK